MVLASAVIDISRKTAEHFGKRLKLIYLPKEIARVQFNKAYTQIYLYEIKRPFRKTKHFQSFETLLRTADIQ